MAVFSKSWSLLVINPDYPLQNRPVAGGGAGGGLKPPPEIFRLEFNSATKVEVFY